MYQYNSIMSAVNDFIDEVNESDSNAKLVKPHTIKDAYELLAGYYGKETGAELLAEYEAGRPHDVADATKLLLDMIKPMHTVKKIVDTSNFRYFHSDGNEPVLLYESEAGNKLYLEADREFDFVLVGDLYVNNSGNKYCTVIILRSKNTNANNFRYYWDGNDESIILSNITNLNNTYYNGIYSPDYRFDSLYLEIPSDRVSNFLYKDYMQYFSLSTFKAQNLNTNSSPYKDLIRSLAYYMEDCIRYRGMMLGELKK